VPAYDADLTKPEIYGGARIQRFPRTGFLSQNVQQWNFFLEKSFSNSWLLSAGYSAAKGSHLVFARVPLTSAQLLPDSLLESWRQSYIANNGRSYLGSEQVRNPLQPAQGPLLPFSGNYSRATVSRLEASLPYTHFAGLEVQRTLGFSNYHAFSAQVKRQIGGLFLNAHYTWSKSQDFSETEATANDFFDTGALSRDQGSGFNMRNWRNNYSYSVFDVPHRLVLTYLYELPIGAGKLIAPKNRILNAAARGWRLGGIGTFQSGTPYQIAGASTGSLNGRPDRIAGVPVEVPKELQRWYDGKTTVTLPSGRQITPCAFCFLQFSSDPFVGRVLTTPNGSVVNDVYWFGNAAFKYNDIRSRGINNWNMSIDRTFRPKENLTVDFSAQFSNAFNHTQFRPRAALGRLGNTNVTVNSSQGTLPGQGLSGDFGTYGTDTYDPRQIEFQLRFRF
jgi:hypothetical protein